MFVFFDPNSDFRGKCVESCLKTMVSLSFSTVIHPLDYFGANFPLTLLSYESFHQVSLMLAGVMIMQDGIHLAHNLWLFLLQIMLPSQ